MIHFDRVPEPDGFGERVEQRGRRWLAENPDGKSLPAYWREFEPHLAQGFRRLCAYSAMETVVGTVDHFVSVSEDRSRAYDWSNYRFAMGLFNTIKSKVRADEILDPFEVEDGWFEIILPSLQLVVSPIVPESHRRRAENCLKRLRLGNDPRVVRYRQSWFERYREGKLSLAGLEEAAPLLAAAVRRQSARGGAPATAAST